jgi:autotransporter-associated beta strand protein
MERQKLHSRRWLGAVAVAAAMFTVAATAFAQTTFTLNGTSGTNVHVGGFSTTGGLTLNLGFFAEYLIVGGGGGGGGYIGGGGGGGGVESNIGQALLQLAASNYTITVGAGGAGGTNNSRGLEGGQSTALGITAAGGGAGGAYNSVNGDAVSQQDGTTGASGGGGAPYNNQGISSDGGGATAGTVGGGGRNSASGFRGGGGGGAGSAGTAGTASTLGNGGAGVASTITGSTVNYAGGGGGGGNSAQAGAGAGGLGGGGNGGFDTSNGSHGTANTGGGGGGGGYAHPNTRTGGNGGSGVVIIRYAGNSNGITGGTVTSGTGTASGYTMHTFTETGSGSLNLTGVDMNARLGTKITSVITGTGNMVYNGPGKLILSGNSTYNGSTTITAGILQLGDGGTQGAINSSAITNNGTLIINRRNALKLDAVVSGTGAFVQEGAGRTTLGGANTFTGGTTINGGSLATTAANRLATNGTVIVNGGGLFLLGGNQQISTLSGAGAVDLGRYTLTSGVSNSTFSGNISGLGGLVKSGAGTFTLSGSNSFFGDSFITEGTLVLNSTTALASDAIVTMSNASTMTVNQRTVIGYLEQNSGTVNGPGQLISSLILTESGALNSVIANGVDYDVGLLKRTAGTTTVSAANTFTGSVRIQGGTMQLVEGGSFAAGSSLVMSAGTMDLNDKSQAFSAVNGAGGTVSLGAGNLTVNGAKRSEFLGAITGTGALAKQGAGTLVLGGTNTYSGATTVSGGRLVVDGVVAGSVVTVESGATLAGSGSVSTTTVLSGGTIAPGNSPGSLSINGDLSWSGGGNYDWEIFSLTGGEGTGWDFLDVSGSLLFADLSSGNKFNINIFSLAGIEPDEIGALADFDAGGSYSWRILGAGSAITGFDANLFNLNTASFVANNPGANANLFTLDAQGSDLFLLYNAGPGPEPIPEPGTWAAAALLVGGAAFLRWRRRKTA